MNKEDLTKTLSAVREELERCEKEHYISASISIKDLSALYESFMRQQFDMEQLAISYAQLLNKNTPLIYYARAVASSVRPAKKGRAYVAADAAAGLEKAVREYGKVDLANRVLEQPPIILSETKEQEPKPVTCQS